TPHAAAAEGQVSLHLSIMMRPRMWKDLLRLSVEEALKDVEFNEYPYVGELRDRSVEDEFRSKVKALHDRLASLDAGAELDRLADVGRHLEGSSAGDTFQKIAATDGLTPEVHVRLSNAVVTFGSDSDGRTPMTVNGHKIAVPSPVAATL